MDAPKSVKFLLRIGIILGLCALLYFGKSVLITLVLAGLIAIILNPVDNWLREKGWSPNLSIAACMLLLVLCFGGVFLAVGSQAARFAENWPTIRERVVEKVNEAKTTLAEMGGGKVETDPQSSEQNANQGGQTGGSGISAQQATDVLQKTAGLLGSFLLMFVYVALLLSQKERLKEFVLRRAGSSQREETRQTLGEIQDVAQQYLKGRLILIGILTVLYGIGFTVAGLDYALVIALLAAVLSIIPYIGNIIGGLIALALAFTGGGDSQQLIGVVVTMGLAQVLESYVLTPLVVGKEVSINSLTTVVGVIAISTLWGPVGAVVAIPVIAMARIVFSHLEGMKDYAYLLGDDDG